ncbi:MAG: hypothetical protein MUE60_00070 [Candidatus Eisenbacteria bacterium]|nr:hypothetical protein [Candidatus Eisenbacteria bacterium]
MTCNPAVWLIISLMTAGAAWAAPGGWSGSGVAWLANPAALADPAMGAWEAYLVHGSVAVRNNAVSLDLYRRYSGEYLDEDDKRTILESISGKTARGFLQGEAEALGIRVGRAAFITRAYLGGDLSLDKDLIDLMFFGNALDRRYELLNSGGMLTYLSAGGSYGFPSGRIAGWETSSGIGARIVLGVLAAKITRSSFAVLTEVEGLTAEGVTVVRRTTDDPESRLPVGVALDLGGRAARDQWELEIVLKDLGPSLSWKGVEEKLVEFQAEEWTAELGDSGYVSSDSTYDVGRWSTPLPARMEVHIGRRLPWGGAYARWNQGLRSWAGVTTSPRVHAGLIWDARAWLRTWLELGAGRPEGFGMAAGLELRPGPLRLRLGATGFRIPTSRSEALGVQFALGAASG